jgi:hypothetical protein
MRIKDFSGQRFHRLLVIKLDFIDDKRNARWLCQCDCGNTKTIRGYQLSSGKTKSCGCLSTHRCSILGKHSLKHGHYKDRKSSKLARVWLGIRQRCYNTRNSHYYQYGGRGISVCDRWRYSFESFLEDVKEPSDENMQFDRIDNNGNYEPNNCRWITAKENMNNRDVSYKKERQFVCIHITRNDTIFFSYCPLCGMNLVAMMPNGQEAGGPQFQ